MHRVKNFSTDGASVITKGDANATSDEPLPVTQVKGKVIGHLPLLGIIPYYIQKTYHDSSLALLILVIFVIGFWPPTQKKQENKESLAETT